MSIRERKMLKKSLEFLEEREKEKAEKEMQEIDCILLDIILSTVLIIAAGAGILLGVVLLVELSSYCNKYSVIIIATSISIILILALLFSIYYIKNRNKTAEIKGKKKFDLSNKSTIKVITAVHFSIMAIPIFITIIFAIINKNIEPISVYAP